MRKSRSVKIVSGLLLVFILCAAWFQTEWIKAEEDEIRFDHTYPETMKVGERIDGDIHYINIYGLTPNEMCGEGVPYCQNAHCTNAERSNYGTMADENGNILNSTSVDYITYKEGEVIVFFSLGRESKDNGWTFENWNEYDVTQIQVEAPIIKHNAPSSVKVADFIDFNTEITNTACTDIKVAEYGHEELFFTTNVEVIEGQDLVKQSAQDYSNSLHTSEKLEFSGIGTVKLKITYIPTIEYIYELISYEDGVVEEIVTIEVEDDKPVVFEPEENPSEEPSEETSEETSEKPSEQPSEEPERETEESYVVPTDTLIVGKAQLDVILEENVNKDVVIKASANIEFTFKKGTMTQVGDKEEYDFTTDIETGYQNKEEYGNLVTQDNFVMQVNFHYSGKLPGEASIKITVGVDKAGMTLYYSKLCADGTIAFICSGIVDENGFLTVRQDSCSDYVLTTERVESVTEDDGVSEEESQKSQTDDEKPEGNNAWRIVVIVIVIIAVAVGIAWVVYKKKTDKI